MPSDSFPGGQFTIGGDITVARVGYGAMQLAGPGVFGPPRDRDEAIAVLRDAIELGINHIDTSDYYGPFVTNQIIREALDPYPDTVCIVTKVGARRDDTGAWLHARTPKELRDAVHDNLRNLGLDTLDVVNLRFGEIAGANTESLAEPFGALAEMRTEGLIRHLGLSTVSMEQIVEAQAIAPVVCVQNFYNVANRHDDHLIDAIAAQGIAYVPFFPLGGFLPLQSDILQRVAHVHRSTPLQVALAWLLHRSPNILLIPGTSSRQHLRENVASATVTLTTEDLVALDAITT